MTPCDAFGTIWEPFWASLRYFGATLGPFWVTSRHKIWDQDRTLCHEVGCGLLPTPFGELTRRRRAIILECQFQL